MTLEKKDDHPAPQGPCPRCRLSSFHEEHVAMMGRWGHRRVFHALICDGCGRTEFFYWKKTWFLYDAG
jgi:predicted nucleic-acid-binding Zn-ribbon protein